MASKRQEPKRVQQEPPADQPDSTQMRTYEAPMAARPPSNEDRIAALERANIELEQRIKKIDTFVIRVARDHSYQYGGST